MRGSQPENKLLAGVNGTIPALEYKLSDGIAIISLGNSASGESPWGTNEEEHRLEPRTVIGLSRALEQAENDDSVQCVVVKAEGRYWSNGFDLKWIQQNMHLADALQQAVELLCAHILQYSKPTLAAVNGHACAAGAMLVENDKGQLLTQLTVPIDDDADF
jgi:1,4-dihydroxy-2-naphthoyl-CoA synthase